MISTTRSTVRLLQVAAAAGAVSALVLSGVASAGVPQAAGAGQPTSALGASVGDESAKDTDGDALPDSWERDGYDADGDGDIDVDLPAMGADPMHKDIFVEMDYMGAEKTCPCHLPLTKDLKRIVKAYENSPFADNPDGERGITIHLDAGDGRSKAFDLGGGNRIAHDEDLNPVDAEFNAIRNENFDKDREKIFHYMLWAHQYGGGTSSGLSFGIGADSFIVTLGAFPEHGTSNAKVGTFIHEIGHNLGLFHGGFENENYKPNYLSVMTYAFQIDGVPRTGDRNGYFGYSDAELPPLDESALKEQKGLDDPAASNFKTKWFCPNGQLTTGSGSASKPIDWNCDGDTKDTAAVNINNFGGLTTLRGHKDWGNLVFDGGRIGEGAGGVISSESPVELTVEEYLHTHAH